jgi:glycosidase
LKWYQQGAFYHIYPLGLCGAPAENDGIVVHRLRRILDWLPHIQALGANAIYLCPVFDSDRHGYDTRDYRRVDPRLGTEADLRELCDACRAELFAVGENKTDVMELCGD